MVSQIPIVTLVARRGDRNKAPMAMVNHSGEAAYPICSHNGNGPDVRGNGNARICILSLGWEDVVITLEFLSIQ
jgi:hypothetical protein